MLRYMYFFYYNLYVRITIIPSQNLLLLIMVIFFDFFVFSKGTEFTVIAFLLLISMLICIYIAGWEMRNVQTSANPYVEHSYNRAFIGLMNEMSTWKNGHVEYFALNCTWILLIFDELHPLICIQSI